MMQPGSGDGEVRDFMIAISSLVSTRANGEPGAEVR
jgi:hypothetical protein